MDWILDHFQILALVGLAFASWLKSRADAKAAEREEQEARRKLEEPEEIFGPDEAWMSPSQQTVQPGPPPLVRAASPPLPAVETQGELKRQMEMQDRLRQIREAKAAAGGATAVTRARTKGGKAAKTDFSVPLSLRGALRQKGQVRNAIVLREILGPPLGLR